VTPAERELLLWLAKQLLDDESDPRQRATDAYLAQLRSLIVQVEEEAA